MTHFILASQSPRRRDLMPLAGYPFQIQTVPVNEASIVEPDPALNSIYTAQLKAQALAEHYSQSNQDKPYIIAADTIVAIDGEMLGKPGNKERAWEMLNLLRNKTHQVHTGICIIDQTKGGEHHGVHSAEVTMRDYSDAEINAYIATKDPLDKAGAYAIQNEQFQPVAHLNGCFLAVMGLSICHLLQLLSQLNIPMHADFATLKKSHELFPCPVYDKLAQK